MRPGKTCRAQSTAAFAPRSRTVAFAPCSRTAATVHQFATSEYGENFHAAPDDRTANGLAFHKTKHAHCV